MKTKDLLQSKAWLATMSVRDTRVFETASWHDRIMPWMESIDCIQLHVMNDDSVVASTADRVAFQSDCCFTHGGGR